MLISSRRYKTKLQNVGKTTNFLIILIFCTIIESSRLFFDEKDFVSKCSKNGWRFSEETRMSFSCLRNNINIEVNFQKFFSFSFINLFMVSSMKKKKLPASRLNYYCNPWLIIIISSCFLLRLRSMSKGVIIFLSNMADWVRYFDSEIAPSNLEETRKTIHGFTASHAQNGRNIVFITVSIVN